MFNVAAAVGEDDVANGGAVLNVAVFSDYFEVSNVGSVGLSTVYILGFGVSLLVDAVNELGVVTAFADVVHFVVTGVLQGADAVEGEVACVVILGAGELGLVGFAVADDVG